MRITNEVAVAREPDELFAQLGDLERVAPCLPGVALEGREGDEHLGRMAVRVGPIAATYRGRLRFVESDPEARRTVIRARGEEVHGHGSAEASITTAVLPEGDGSRIVVDADLQLRGRVAQFGRGAVGPIAERLLGQFAANLEALPPPGEQPPAGVGDGRGAATAAAPPAAEALDLGTLLPGGRTAERVAIGLAGALLGFAYGYLAGRLRELRRPPA